MRTLMLALMIALLPIRGWLGDTMAVEMAGHRMPAVAAAAAIATSSSSTAAAVHCHGAMDTGDGMDMAAMDPVATHGGHGDPHGSGSLDHQGCGTCTVCQVCHTVALGGMPGTAIAHAAPQTAPVFLATRFASAEPVPGLKPPIS